MAMNSNHKLRLRIVVATSIKFYISVSQTSSVIDLINSVTKILGRHYSYALSEFEIQSEDGFDILDQFPLGEVLQDDQVVHIRTPMTRPVKHKLRSPASGATKHKTKQSRRSDTLAAVNGIEKYYNDNKEFLHAEAESLKEKIKQATESRPEECIAAVVNAPGNTHLPEAERGNQDSSAGMHDEREEKKPAPAHFEVSTTAEQPAKIAADLVQAPSAQERTEANTNTKTDKDLATVKDGVVKFSPTFKGFAVKKKELEKGKFATSVLSAAFQPIKKKRKHEEVYDSI